MPSPFDELDAAMQADVDALFGEGIRILPQAGDQYTKGPDPARAVAANVRATVARAPQAKKADFRGTATNGVPVTTAPAELWIDRASYVALGYALRKGDVIVLTDDPSSPEYRVAAVHPGDGGDVQIILG